MKLLLSTALAVLFACGTASANCGPSLRVVATLSQAYGETAIETELAVAPGSAVEVQYSIWLNEQTGTWSFTGTRNGITCLFASGKEYGGQTLADFLGHRT